jgi:hypothetical protein
MENMSKVRFIVDIPSRVLVIESAPTGSSLADLGRQPNFRNSLE